MTDIALSSQLKLLADMQSAVEKERIQLAASQQELTDTLAVYGAPHFLAKVDKCIEAANSNTRKQDQMASQFTQQCVGIQSMYEHIVQLTKDVQATVERDIAERAAVTKLLTTVAGVGGQFETVTARLAWLTDKVSLLADLQNPGSFERSIKDE